MGIVPAQLENCNCRKTSECSDNLWVASQVQLVKSSHLWQCMLDAFKLMPCSIYISLVPRPLPHKATVPVLSSYALDWRYGSCYFTFEVAAVCVQSTTCFCMVTGTYSQLSNFYVWKFTLSPLWQLMHSWSFYQVPLVIYSFPPLVWTPLAVARTH